MKKAQVLKLLELADLEAPGTLGRLDPFEDAAARSKDWENRADVGWHAANRLVESGEEPTALNAGHFRWVRAATCFISGTAQEKLWKDIKRVNRAVQLHADECRASLLKALLFQTRFRPSRRPSIELQEPRPASFLPRKTGMDGESPPESKHHTTRNDMPTKPMPTIDSSLKTVARAVGEMPGVVLAFADLFFNVIDRRHEHAYIAAVVRRELTEGSALDAPVSAQESKKWLEFAPSSSSLEELLVLVGLGNNHGHSLQLIRNLTFRDALREVVSAGPDKAAASKRALNLAAEIHAGSDDDGFQSLSDLFREELDKTSALEIARANRLAGKAPPTESK